MAKSKRPSSKSDSVSIDWNEFEAAAAEFIHSHLKRLTKLIRSKVVYGVHIHCQPEAGEIFPYLDVRPPAVGQNAIQFPGYPDHRPWEPNGLDYTLEDWDFVELEPADRSPAVRRWHKSSSAFYEAYSKANSDEARIQLAQEFLHHTCLAALRLEQETGFEFVPKREACCILYVEDHDEWRKTSWLRLVRARIEFAPPWKEGNAWPIRGRQPEIACATFACAADYREQGQLKHAAHLLRQAVACLPELQGATTYKVSGTRVRLPIPENEAWARAFLGAAEQSDWDQDRERQKALKTALRFAPDLADVHHALAHTRDSDERRLKDLDRAIKLDADRPEFFAYRGETRLYAESQHWPQAVADFTRAHELDPFNQKWLMHRAALHEKMGHDEAAIADYTRVFELRHSVVSWYIRDALVGRANCFQRLGRYRDAIGEWDRLLAYEQRSEYFQNRAMCHKELGNTSQAAQDLETAKRLKQDEY